jgi:hypothetical protein
MVGRKPVVVSQQEFLRDAIQRLGLTRAGFAKRISVPKWGYILNVTNFASRDTCAINLPRC